jgi:hypothetical protein
MAKNNIRSFRFSDAIGEILEKQEGNSLNEKFTNLVYHSFLYSEKIEKQIEDLLKRREYLVNQLSDLQDKSRQLIMLKSDIDGTVKLVADIERRAKYILDDNNKL